MGSVEKDLPMLTDLIGLYADDPVDIGSWGEAEEAAVLFSSTGEAVFLYDDALSPVLDIGQATIERASHVEPEGLQWVADMAPVGGPKSQPFDTREQALQWERDWIWGNHFQKESNNGKARID